MKVKQLFPEVNLRFQFSFKDHKFIPKESGCYVLTSFEDEILYVGLTNNLNSRFAKHRNSREKCQKTSQGTVFWFYYLTCEEREINRVERGWLNQHVELHGALPVLNKVNSPVS